MRTHRILLVTAAAAVAATLAQSAASAGVRTSPAAGISAAAVAVAPALSTVRLNPTDVVEGTSSTGTVTLTAAAPAGGLPVALSSDNPGAAAVQPSVTVPAGTVSASFPVTTFTGSLTNPSALIIGTAGGVTAYGILTVHSAASINRGFIDILPAGNGSGTITSQPAGINCVITLGSGAGACEGTFTTGTVVRLVAKAAAGSKFAGFRGTPGCGDPSKVTVSRGIITCQGGFVL